MFGWMLGDKRVGMETQKVKEGYVSVNWIPEYIYPHRLWSKIAPGISCDAIKVLFNNHGIHFVDVDVLWWIRKERHLVLLKEVWKKCP